MHFRQITPADIPALFAVRTATAENRLSSEDLEVAGITPESVRELLSANHQGWLCEVEGKVVGFCMGDGESGELWVIALLPEFEGRGIGGQLLGKVETWLWSMGHSSLWLWTDVDKTRRAYGFYIRHAWVSDEIAGDDLRMVKFRTPA